MKFKNNSRNSRNSRTSGHPGLACFQVIFEYQCPGGVCSNLTAAKGFSQHGLTDKERPCHLKTLQQTETAPRGRLTHGIVLQAKTDACSASSFYKNTTCGLKMKKYPYHIRKTLLYFFVTFFTNHFILTFLWVKCVISIIVEITLTLLNNQLIRLIKSWSFSF